MKITHIRESVNLEFRAQALNVFNIVNFSPVPSRQIEGAWVGGFNSSRASMDERQRRRLNEHRQRRDS